MAIGSLAVELSANVARFQADMEKMRTVAETQLERINGFVESTKQAIGALGAAAGLGLGFEALTERIEGTIEAAANLEKVSQRTGATVAGLADLSVVAKLSGTGVDQLAAGLQKLSKAMVDAENGGAKTTAAFSAIGLSVKDLASQTPDEVFKQIATRLDQYQDGASKVALTQILLGKSGADLLPVLKDLVENGDLHSKVTEEQAKQAEILEKDWARIKLVAHENADAVIREWVPALTRLTENMRAAQTAGAGFLQTFVSIPLQDLFANIIGTTTQERIDGARASVERLKAALNDRSQTPEFLASVQRQLKAAEASLQGLLAAQRAAALQGAGDLSGVTDQVTRQQNQAKPEIKLKLHQQDDAKALLDNQLKTLDAFIKSEDSLLKTRDQTLAQYYREDKIGIIDYFAAKNAAEQEAVASTVATYNKEIVAVHQFIDTAKDEKTAIEGKTKLAEVQAKLQAEIAKGAAEQTKNTIDQAQALQVYADKVEGLNIKLLTLQGHLGAAAKAQAELTYRQQEQQAIANHSQRAVDDIEALKAREITQGEINQRIQDASLIEERLATTIGRVNLAQQTGQIGELEALAKTDAARRAQIDQLQKIADEYLRIAQLSGDPKKLAAADAFKLKIDQLAASTDSLTKKFTDLFENDFAAGFAKVIQGTESVSKAFKDMANSILQQLSQLAAQDIAKKIFGAISGGSGSGGGAGGFLASLMAFLPKFANGGDTTGSGAYIVGERGPELFTPGQSGRVSPLSAVGSSPTIHVHVGNGASVTRDSANLIGATVARHLATLHARNN